MESDHLSDEAVAALLKALAAEHGGRVAIEHVDGHWRAGFAVRDELGEIVIRLSVDAPDRAAVMRKLWKVASHAP